MKKENVFIVLMVIEALAALVAMGLLFSAVGILIYPIALALFAAVLVPLFRKLKKAEDEEEKQKIRRKMALIMLLPIAAGVIAVAAVVILLIVGIGL